MSDDEISAALGGLPGWELADGALTKQFRLGRFPAAVAFVVRLSTKPRPPTTIPTWTSATTRSG